MAEYVTKEQVKEEILNWARCINKPERLVMEDTMCVIVADAVGVKLGDVFRNNIEKLEKRFPDGFSKERSINREQ